MRYVVEGSSSTRPENLPEGFTVHVVTPIVYTYYKSRWGPVYRTDGKVVEYKNAKVWSRSNYNIDAFVSHISEGLLIEIEEP